MILLSNPDYIMKVLKTNFMNYRKSNLYKEIKPILGEGLVNGHGDHWKRIRRTVGPESSHKNIFKNISSNV